MNAPVDPDGLDGILVDAHRARTAPAAQTLAQPWPPQAHTPRPAAAPATPPLPMSRPASTVATKRPMPPPLPLPRRPSIHDQATVLFPEVVKEKAREKWRRTAPLAASAVGILVVGVAIGSWLGQSPSAPPTSPLPTPTTAPALPMATAPVTAPPAAPLAAPVAPSPTTGPSLEAVAPAGPAVSETFPASFAFNSVEPAAIRPHALEQLVDALARCGGPIRLVGHTCGLGTDPSNEQAGLLRAEAVKAILVQRGLEPARIEVASAANFEPIASNLTVRGRDANRRVVVTCPANEPAAGSKPRKAR